MDNGRRETRHDISVPGRYRTGNGVPKDVDVLEISERGCRFYDRFGRLVAGSELTFRVGPIGPIPATVRWCNDYVVGIEFETPIYGPVLEHIRSQLDAGRE